MTTSHDPVVEARGLSKRFGRILAVDDLTFEVRPGEVYGLLGPNGAGKSTTMRMLLGLVAPTGGAARIAGHPAGSPRAMAACGALVEGPGLYPHLSGRRNLDVIASYRGVASADVDETLEVVGLADRARDRYATYSLGMKQRLGVAAALLARPPVLVLDEPTNGLDPAGVLAFLELVRDLAASGRTVVLSSHVLRDVEQVCDRVGIINAGRLVSEADLRELPRRVRITAEPVQQAFDLVAEHLGDRRAVLAEGRLELTVDEATVATLNETLVRQGVAVDDLRVEAVSSLEETFLELTEEPAERSATEPTLS